MDYAKLKNRLLKVSAFAFVAGGIFSMIGIYTGGLDALVIPESFLNLLTVFGVTL
ncbi:hypothetical protein MmiHf6_15100 [Methanimicrococcus hongohii]|uniref:Uncharacterized protein n=1 Tax=Methanimicrococcus hongohii TaxID=3028295 RepID=A0AA96V9X1_9EURY|nr:hypothetical protein [Methanimicrococcus sp. Hf6]WNY24181.1 hypothetical protein MmiHf6_15100 [Methanimicrococcus sp. Hf6]